MSGTDFQALLPLIVTAGTAIVVMLAITVYRRHGLILGLTLAGLIAGLLSIVVAVPLAPRQVTPLILIDAFALYYIGLMLAASIVVALLAYGYFRIRRGRPEELYLLLLIATVGAGVLVAATHFASFFLGLEILSVSLYAMLAYQRDDPLGIEAGTKYLILAGTSSAIILFGMASLYAAQGTMVFNQLLFQAVTGTITSPLAMLGVALILAGLAFKLALVPFHFWTPDVYQGSPAPVTAFIATSSKGAVFALVLRFFAPLPFQEGFTALVVLFTVLAIASMTVGNLLALGQPNVKRILAYSSIAHMGYLLVAFLAGGRLAAIAVTFYLTAYFITILGAFGVVSLLSVGKREAEEIDDYRGLAWHRPWLALTMTAMLLSLAGMPLTAGFIGKFLALAAGIRSNLWALSIIFILNSGTSIYYYLRIVVAIYASPKSTEAPSARPAPYPLMPLGGFALAVLLLLIIWFGVYPGPLLRLIESAVALPF
ncbi:MAG: NADH-quinone oxidoreductase subunit N [Armatimonadota bacterium]